jgi:hypothetical protein
LCPIGYSFKDIVAPGECDEVRILAEELRAETDRPFSAGDFYSHSVARLKLRWSLDKAWPSRWCRLLRDLLPHFLVHIFRQLAADTDEIEKPVCLCRRDTLLGKEVAVSHLEERSTTGQSARANSNIADVFRAVV